MDNTDMVRKKVALVTGGTSGIGLSLLPFLLQANYRIYFIGRNAAKGKEIETKLNDEYNKNNSTSNNPRENDNPNKVATFVQLDLSDLDSVKAFAIKFREEIEPKLDLLANIGGMMVPTRQTIPKYGYEKTLAVNYLSAYILSTELTPALCNAASNENKSRIVNIGGVGLDYRTDLEDLASIKSPKKYDGMAVAVKTLHLKTVLTEILAERFKDKNITVNSFNPGTVKGNITRDMNFVMRTLMSIVQLFWSSTSANGIHLTTSDDVVNITGHYFDKKHVGIPIHFEDEYKDLLWNKTIEITSKI